jgi:DNA-binding YbaB/EbfC family protein
MFGSLGDLAGIIRQAKSLKENMDKMQEQLAAQRFEGQAGAGMVRAEVNGKLELLRVQIDPAAMGDREMLEDLIVAASAAAMSKAQEAVKAEMAKLTGGLNIPGLPGLLNAGS